MNGFRVGGEDRSRAGKLRGDVCNPVAPGGLEARLTAAGFAEVRVNVNPYVVEFRARR